MVSLSIQCLEGDIRKINLPNNLSDQNKDDALHVLSQIKAGNIYDVNVDIPKWLRNFDCCGKFNTIFGSINYKTKMIELIIL